MPMLFFFRGQNNSSSEAPTRNRTSRCPDGVTHSAPRKCADSGLGAAAGSGGSNLRHLPGYRRLARGYRRRDHGRDGGTRSTQPARGEIRNNVDGSRRFHAPGRTRSTKPVRRGTRGKPGRCPKRRACDERLHALGRHRGMGDHCDFLWRLRRLGGDRSASRRRGGERLRQGRGQPQEHSASRWRHRQRAQRKGR